MKRIVKKPEVRRMEIITVAKKLFIQNGYEYTSVEAIIQETGIAKGTFYYYFKSKKEILNALVDLSGKEMFDHFEAILKNKSISATEKFKLMLRGPEKKAKTASFLMKTIKNAENRELQEKLNIQVVKILAPLILKVFEEGKKEGVFTELPSIECVQLLLAGSQFVLDSGLFNWEEKKHKAFLYSIQTMFEKTVGTKSGSFSFITEE